MRNWKNIVRTRIEDARPDAASEVDLIDEIGLHLEDCYRELRAGGASDEEAYRQTLSELDDMYPLQAELEEAQRIAGRDLLPAGDAKPGNFIEDLWRDTRYALRTMRKSPLFVVFVVLTLALGIGANTTVFTLINTLILNPLPVPNSSQLFGVTLAASASKSGAPQPISYADLKDYESRNEVFTSLGGYTSPRLLTWQTGETSERLFGELVTGAYFSTLEIQPAKGRFFLPEEDLGTPGAHAVVVMNYGTWQTRFGGASDILGKTLRLNNTVFTVVGIAPPRFIGVNAIFGPDFWIPAAMAEQIFPNEMETALSSRSKALFQGLARLKPGVTPAAARANLATIAAALARDYPETDAGRTAILRPIRDALFTSSTGGRSPIVFGSIALLMVVGIVLLIACSNVANLLLARSAARQQEMAVRLAMGASRRRLVRQFLTESVLLGLFSGMAGLLFGYAALRLLWSSLPSAANFVAPKFDANIFVFTLAVSLATGFLFGAIPAFRASRGNVADALKEEARTTGKSRGKVTVANALLVGQVAFSFLLLVTAALFLRSIGRAYEIDPGFQTAHLAIFMTNPGQTGYGKAQTLAFYKDVRERLQRMPEVVSVSWAAMLPLWSRAVNQVQVEGRQVRSEADQISSVVNTIDLAYFETAGVTIDRGREFTNVDQEDSTPVAIVNEKMAHDYWPNGEALGKRIQLPDEKKMRQIVGIAKTGNYSEWGEPPQACLYVPLQQKYTDSMILYVRSTGDPKRVLIPVPREIHAAGPKIVVSSQRTGHEIVENGLFQEKMGVLLLSVFGLLALGLACIGLYGIMAYSVAQRRREIGLRMALGAAQSTVLRLVLKQGMSLVATGVLIGFTAALGIGRLLSRMLYGISASDPISVVGAAAVLMAVAFIACYLPARAASRVDPLVALREG